MVAIDKDLDALSVDEAIAKIINAIADLKMTKNELERVKKSEISFEDVCNSDEVADLFDTLEGLQLALTYTTQWETDDEENENDEPYFD